MIFCKNLTKTFGAQTLFKNADFQLNSGEKVGIVGRNGYGKSTLFHMILKKDAPDEGEISYPDNYHIGSMDQHIQFSKKNIVDEVTQVLTGDQIHDTWKAEKLLSGLGFSNSDFTKSPNAFSGGFQTRIKLAQLLLSEPDLLLLDEPTNYLDIVSIRWLEFFLKQWKGELLCISHDQTFLENITNFTAIIHRQKFKKVKGPPAKCYDQIKKEEQIHEKTRLNDKKGRAKQEKFIREFRSGARSAGLVQSRIKMLEKKEKLHALPVIAPIKFHFPECDFTGARMLEAHNLSFGYQSNQDLLKKVSLEILPGEKIGIIGANGKGKTTLLSVLSGNLPARTGTLKLHSNAHFGYFGQSNIERLDKTRNIIEEISAHDDVGEQTARSVAGSLLFSGDLAYKKIEILSGGEKARVNLGKILVHSTNFLLLDEPTNHLDYESVNVLINALKKYAGSVIFVSHNEHFLRSVAEKLVVFDDDQVYVFQGNYETFLSKTFCKKLRLDVNCIQC